ncbi:MAG TPA: carbohydrate porin [Spirochaetota bacterium]|nr:carbohydrate porin [Spirochaetota bacterium]
MKSIRLCVLAFICVLACAASPAFAEEPEVIAAKWFEKIDVAFGATGIVQGARGVAETPENTKNRVTDYSHSFDIEITAPVRGGGKIFFHFEAGSGEGIDPMAETMSRFNRDVYDEPAVSATELWYEQEWLNGGLRLRLGKVDLTTDFDTNAAANNETFQFLSEGFRNSPVIAFPEDNGFGGMLWLSPHDSFSLGLATADARGEGDKAFSTPFFMSEVVFSPCLVGNRGNYRLYAWHSGKRHREMFEPEDTGIKNYGFGFSFDQKFFGFLTLFSRGGMQRQEEYAGSAGFEISGSAYGREVEALGLAFGVILLGSDWKKSARDKSINPGNEYHAEVYYRIKIHEYLAISPDVQWVRNPNGDTDTDDVWVFGARAQLNF